MKFSWAERSALLLTAVTLAVFALWFLRGGTEAGGYTVSAAHPARPLPSATAQVFVPDALLDLNAAGPEDLMGLPGVGETRARAILDYRARHGPFTAAEELMEVPGIGASTFARLEPYITVTTP